MPTNINALKDCDLHKMNKTNKRVQQVPLNLIKSKKIVKFLIAIDCFTNSLIAEKTRFDLQQKTDDNNRKVKICNELKLKKFHTMRLVNND